MSWGVRGAALPPNTPPPPHQPPATENYEIFRQTANDSGNDT